MIRQYHNKSGEQWVEYEAVDGKFLKFRKGAHAQLKDFEKQAEAKSRSSRAARSARSSRRG